MSEQAADRALPPTTGAHPPVTQLAVTSLVLVLIGGIYMVGTYQSSPSLAIPAALLIGSVVLWLASVLLMARHRGFAWPIFSRIARWALLAYVIEAGMIEYSFIHNNVRGTTLLLLSLMLVMFALDVTVSIAFTVARFATPAD
ncbi:MAG TPA: hypothetical protein VGK33_13260 [Chloroflexota bacterium]